MSIDDPSFTQAYRDGVSACQQMRSDKTCPHACGDNTNRVNWMKGYWNEYFDAWSRNHAKPAITF